MMFQTTISTDSVEQFLALATLLAKSGYAPADCVPPQPSPTPATKPVREKKKSVDLTPETPASAKTFSPPLPETLNSAGIPYTDVQNATLALSRAAPNPDAGRAAVLKLLAWFTTDHASKLNPEQWALYIQKAKEETAKFLAADAEGSLV